MQEDVTEKLDALGLRCPLPVLKARKRLKSMTAGDVLRIDADDPAAIIDVPHFCTEQGYTLLDQQKNGETLTFLIKK